MSSTWGEKIKISVFGESHGNGIGVVIDGLESGHKIDMDKVLVQMSRRMPGRDKTSTPRKEKDLPKVLSGMLNDTTTGAPLCAVIENTNTQSSDYNNLLKVPRPGHSDYTAFLKYNGYNDISGGGHFSGRLTAPLVFAGAICRQILAEKGITIAAHIKQIANVEDEYFNDVNLESKLMERLSESPFSLINTDKEDEMRQKIEEARLSLDSVGGIVECAVNGVQGGLGGPLFGGVEGAISSIMFGIPAVKGIEFGNGFKCAELKGSENNDSFEYKNGQVVTKTNNCGGILGGITDGMPIIFRMAIKPTPSIAQEQESVDLDKKCNTKLCIKGRHDPCIVQRAVPVIEACSAIAILNLL